MDPLSDVMALLKPRSYMAGGFDAGGQWSIRYRPGGGIKCYAVVSGACWMRVEGVDAPVRLRAGDCFLLPGGRPFCLTSDLALPPMEADAVYAAARAAGTAVMNGITVWNGGGDCLIVGSYFALSGAAAGLLLGMLPPIVHITEKTDQAALLWSVERMMDELRAQRPGGVLVVEHLAHMMLLQALRLHLAEGAAGGVGWLFALADRQMGAAIGAIHEAPARRWTLEDLAARAAMSRSNFALKFKESVGASPMEYLTRWRMMLAGERLLHGGEAVSVIALSLGYESESAFSTAFKRVMGCSPRQYRAGQALLAA